MHRSTQQLHLVVEMTHCMRTVSGWMLWFRDSGLKVVALSVNNKDDDDVMMCVICINNVITHEH